MKKYRLFTTLFIILLSCLSTNTMDWAHDEKALIDEEDFFIIEPEAQKTEIKYSDLTRENYDEWFQRLASELNVDFLPSLQKRYFVISSDLFKGERDGVILNDFIASERRLIREPGQDAQEYYQIILKDLLGNYKIHLMPRNEQEMLFVLKGLLEELKNPDSDFTKNVKYFKFMPGITFDSIPSLLQQITTPGEEGEEVLPLFAIYPSTSKESAQKVLNSISSLFFGMDGINITPRYNKQVNSLIFYAQGDGEHKGANVRRYYSKDMIFYSPTIEGARLRKDYSLKNPI